MTRIVALTGNVASGKSTVAARFGEWGATIIDVDALVRELQQPGAQAHEAIVARFGPGVLLPDGRLNRAALRRTMLADPVAKRDLEAIVHPLVADLRRSRTEAAVARGAPIVVVDIPLLFEADDPRQYDAVVLVDAPVAIRRARLVAGRGLAPDEADRLIAAQLPTALKRRAADHVIDNDGDLATLEARSRAVWQALTRS